jgi:hypothetical protein
VEKNIVISPAGLKCAKLLERKFSTPWEIRVPDVPQELVQKLLESQAKRILIVHNAFAAAEVKKQLLAADPAREVFTGSFFNKCSNECDYKFAGESDFYDAVEAGNFDLIAGDNVLHRVVQRFYRGEWVDFVHFAVSGRLLED